MERIAIVTRIEGQTAMVELASDGSAASGCGRCDEAGGCRSGLLNQALRPKYLCVYRLPNAIGAKVGDRVIVSVPEGAVLRAAMWAYLLPILFLIIGAAVGTMAFDEDVFALIGAGIGLGLGLFALRKLQPHLSDGGELFPKMRLE